MNEKLRPYYGKGNFANDSELFKFIEEQETKDFRSNYPRDPKKIQNEIPNRVTMGNKKEMLLLPQYKRIKKRNDFLNPEDFRRVKFYLETIRILGNLKLPIRLKYSVLKNAEKFYLYFKSYSYCRGPRILIPVSVYITCLETFIFVNRKEISNYNDCTRGEFNRCLKGILKKNDTLRKKLRSDDFRIETILNQLIGLRNHFKLPSPFIKVSIHYLHQYFEKLKGTKETVITARLFRLTKIHLKEKMEPFTSQKACLFLGVSPSVCSNNKIFKREELNMPRGVFVRTPEMRKKTSETLKGKYKGEKNPMYGKHHTDETKKKLSEINKGKHLSEEAKKRIGDANRGKNSYWYGKIGEENPNWKGGIAYVTTFHNRVRKIKPIPEVCEFCYQKTDKKEIIILELSNIKNHQYTDNPDDYKWVHHSCHNTYDSKKRKKR